MLQLSELVQSIQSSSQHFIRCIKSNRRKKAREFDEKLVLEQLRYGGIFETIRISKTGYPSRQQLPCFVRRYAPLEPQSFAGVQNVSAPPAASAAVSASTCIHLREPVRAFLLSKGFHEVSDFQVGATRVFLRSQPQLELEKRLQARMCDAVLVIQRRWSSVLTRRAFTRVKVAVVRIQ